MELKTIPIEQLHISKLNMRYGRKNPDVSDILPSVREKGILLPLIVRPEDDGFGVIAGGRRYRCGEIIREEGTPFAPPLCAVMGEGDDAEAIEISLIENFARRDPDPFSEYETFARLVKAGRSVDGIAATFGVTPQTVKQRLALANLLPKIKDAYRAEDIDDETVQHLTMATKAQQKEWLALYESEDGNAPTGSSLKRWLFGGASISTTAALFALDQYTGQIVNDLFGEESYFANAETFWEAQSAVIDAKAEALREAGWSEVIVLEQGTTFSPWGYEKTAKTKGGKVFVEIAYSGQVKFHEGWITKKEAEKTARADAKAAAKADPEKSAGVKPQMTQAMENYVELYRHGIVRLALLRDPNVALRLMVAHALAPTGNWSVSPDPLRARSTDIDANLRKRAAFVAFESEYAAVVTLLDLPKQHDTVDVFARLLALTDEEVLRIAAFAMALTLAVGDTAVEAAGLRLNATAAELWQPDDLFFELIRDRPTVNAVLAEVAGKSVAKSNKDEKVKSQKKIVRDCLTGENGRSKVENWLPGWMQFPFKPYGKGASRIAAAAKDAAKALHI
ncbi:MAG TPA: ParB/RepB/Spo0J family partition protein [Rhizomicrobium sp.]|nr:ParB/RepB/Spo0J family partition protein [Rhizomicrobium sp.]